MNGGPSSPSRARRIGRLAVAAVVPVVVAVALTACGGESGGTADGQGTLGPAGSPPNGATGAAPGSASGLAAAPEGGWGFGRAATSEEIEAWDIDVGPDGEGLPPGSGTAVEGAEVYRTQCQACHGETGVEGPNTVLVSAEPLQTFAFGSDPGMRSTVGNYWPYATTIFDYVRRSMPFDRPGILTDDEVYAVTAWLLWMNGLVEEDATMDASSLPAVEMPARPYFVTSDDVPPTELP